jgi:cystathionine beta-lyase/cystathionine gamma-synthase
MTLQELQLRKEDESETLQVLCQLAEGLQREINHCKHQSTTKEELLKDIREFQYQCQDRSPEINYQDWCNLWHSYQFLVLRKGNFLNEISTFAHTYPSMEAFWDDAKAQVQGKSSNTYWDTYEHGRRRQLEQILANTYGSESALLVNTGMSTIAVVVGMLNLCQGSKILTGERCYFETSDYLDRYLVPRGVEIIRVPVDNHVILGEAIKVLQPELAIFETVTNVPDVTALLGFPDCLADSPNTFFLIDNSAQSHLTRWFDITKTNIDRILVVESTGKYLTHESMGGVIYGSREAVEKARDFARATGQQLQEKSFNYLCEAELEQVSWQLARHSRNVTAFIEDLQEYSVYFDYIRALNSGMVNKNVDQQIFSYGVGSLVFVALPRSQSHESENLSQRHRHLMDEWFKRIKAVGLDIKVQCGFGWKETVARVYESSYLNQPDAPSYLRISVGIEPLEHICMFASLLGQVAQNLTV